MAKVPQKMLKVPPKILKVLPKMLTVAKVAKITKYKKI